MEHEQPNRGVMGTRVVTTHLAHEATSYNTLSHLPVIDPGFEGITLRNRRIPVNTNLKKKCAKDPPMEIEEPISKPKVQIVKGKRSSSRLA